MESKQAVESLFALAQESRLAIFRKLVEAGPEGLAAGRIGEAFDLSPATLSFHLSHLARAGLIRSRQEGRFVIYTADFAGTNALVGYLTENCCEGASCASGRATPKKASRLQALPRSRH